MNAELATAPKTSAEVQWTKCPSCDAFVYFKRLKRNLGVCPECNFHFRLPIRERLAQLLDEGSFVDLSDELEPIDVLGFADSKPYVQRLADAQRKTGGRDAALYGTAAVDGHALVLAAMDFAFIGGSMGSAVGEAITRAAERALESRTPLLVIAASGGARMQEGAVSLMQMAKTSQAIARLHEEGILFVCLLTDPTYGGVSASFATLGDVLVAEPASYIGFAGPKVIEQTIRQKLPEGFQTSEFLMDHGQLDLVEPRENLRHTLRKLLELHALAERGGTAEALPETDGRAPIADSPELARRPAWDVVQLARHIERPTTLEYLGYAFDDFLELHGDRLFDEDPAIVGGIARLGDLAVVVVGHQKGHTTGEMMERNFGMPNPEGYRKALRLMQYAAKFRMPIVTLVDTPGAYPGLGGEERGQSIAIARSIMEMSRLPVPIVVIVTGEGGSGGALALAVGDRVLAMENSYYSVISPEGCSTILFKDAAQAPRAAEALRLTAPDLVALGIMDAAIPEPEGGAHTDPPAAAANLKTAIVSNLRDLLGTQPEDLLRGRYERFRAFGTPGRQAVLTTTREPMTDDKGDGAPDVELLRAVWDEARELVKRLEGSTVQRLEVEAGKVRIEIERGVATVAGGPVALAPAAGAAAADGAPAEADTRHRIVSPLVGTFYRAPQPGAPPFVEPGDVVDEGQTVAIVEAMKLMNQVKADRGGRVAEIAVEEGAWVEFEQVLIYLEDVGE